MHVPVPGFTGTRILTYFNHLWLWQLFQILYEVIDAFVNTYCDVILPLYESEIQAIWIQAELLNKSKMDSNPRCLDASEAANLSFLKHLFIKLAFILTNFCKQFSEFSVIRSWIFLPYVYCFSDGNKSLNIHPNILSKSVLLNINFKNWLNRGKTQ